MASAQNISSPDVASLLGPLLLGLPAAAVSTQPATALLPLLSPILRQRVQLFSTGSQEPWLRLLCYDTAKAARLGEIAGGGRIEPHPVSGEVEVDWDSDTQMRYRRLDHETLQALVALTDLELAFQLVYCLADQDGGSDGWRIGEVTVVDAAFPFSSFGGQPSVAQAEETHRESKRQPQAAGSSGFMSVNGGASTTMDGKNDEDDEDDDDDYWARYDATPARTPATKRSPAPGSMQTSQTSAYRNLSAEDEYYAQYDGVQPAMDPHDPDEARNMDIDVAPPLGLGRVVSHDNPSYMSPEQAELNETNGAWTLAEPDRSEDEEDRLVDLAHPRPSSSAGSNGSQTVAKLEESAARQEQSDFGVKQHVGRSIRSLFLLSRAAGIDREEFERLVRTELDVLGMIESHE
jgi:hypothetical protein